MKKKLSQKGKEKIELNPQFKRAYELMENTHKHLFVTGRAGTGKSTLLTYFREHTKKEIVVLAPTGVAAVNIKGQTIHSFFGFKPDVTLQKIRNQRTSKEEESIYQKLDTIVIDEISMVRADLLDCIDKFMRINGKDKERPFGGVQMILIGDLYQLPPVLTSEDKIAFLQKYTSPYFFASHVFSGQRTLLSDEGDFELTFVELEKIYRQKDTDFIVLLNAIRDNTVTDAQIAVINAQYDPTYEPDQEDFEIYLTTTNDMAAKINEKELAKLGMTSWRFQGERSGKFEERLFPTNNELEVKVGAQIMLLNNDRQGRWINGTIGKIESIEKENGETLVWVELADGTVELVAPYTWDMYEYTYDKKKGHIEADVIGSFTQYPFKLAWAVTIHKAQGKTFDSVILDIGRGTFAPGQLYVALSRCTRLEGIVLATQISKRNVWTDMNVVTFVKKFQEKNK